MGDPQKIFYLAAKYSKRVELLPIAALLMMHGHKVHCNWLLGCHAGVSDEEQRAYAEEDLGQIAECTHFVLFQLPVEAPEPSTGRQIELGYALSLNKACFIVGDGGSIFYTLTTRYKTIGAFLEMFAPNGRLM